MKRTRIIGVVLLLFALGFLVIIYSSRTDPSAPRYVTLQNQPAGPFGSAHYNWSGPAPFFDSKVWIFTALNSTNSHEFLFDLGKRKVLGELFNGGPVFFNQEHTKLLCQGHASLETSIKEKLSGLLSRLSLRRINIITNRTEAYWILDLRNNSARRVGGLSQWPGTGSTWIPAPGFRFGFNVPNNSEEGAAFFVCDLEQESFRKIPFTGYLRGWWDDRRILIKKPTGDWILYDVLTQNTSTLLNLETISRRLHELGIPDDPATLTTCSIWNGTDYEFRLVASQGWNWYTNGSFMLKIERSGFLTLSRQNFKFKWLGKFNAAETYYVYDSEPGAIGRGGNGGILVLDLLDDTTATLVPPDNKGQYAIPRFYGDSVLYFRDHQIWSIKLDGSENIRLFPPPDK
jgi:hypothetical protein